MLDNKICIGTCFTVKITTKNNIFLVSKSILTAEFLNEKKKE